MKIVNIINNVINYLKSVTLFNKRYTYDEIKDLNENIAENPVTGSFDYNNYITNIYNNSLEYDNYGSILDTNMFKVSAYNADIVETPSFISLCIYFATEQDLQYNPDDSILTKIFSKICSIDEDKLSAIKLKNNMFNGVNKIIDDIVLYNVNNINMNAIDIESRKIVYVYMGMITYLKFFKEHPKIDDDILTLIHGSYIPLLTNTLEDYRYNNINNIDDIWNAIHIDSPNITHTIPWATIYNMIRDTINDMYNGGSNDTDYNRKFISSIFYNMLNVASFTKKDIDIFSIKLYDKNTKYKNIAYIAPAHHICRYFIPNIAVFKLYLIELHKKMEVSPDILHINDEASYFKYHNMYSVVFHTKSPNDDKDTEITMTYIHEHTNDDMYMYFKLLGYIYFNKIWNYDEKIFKVVRKNDKTLTIDNIIRQSYYHYSRYFTNCSEWFSEILSLCDKDVITYFITAILQYGIDEHTTIIYILREYMKYISIREVIEYHMQNKSPLGKLIYSLLLKYAENPIDEDRFNIEISRIKKNTKYDATKDEFKYRKRYTIFLDITDISENDDGFEKDVNIKIETQMGNIELFKGKTYDYFPFGKIVYGNYHISYGYKARVKIIEIEPYTDEIETAALKSRESLKNYINYMMHCRRTDGIKNGKNYIN